MADKQEEWFKKQMANERFSPRTKAAPNTVTGSLIVAKRPSNDGYVMRIHTKGSATTVEKNFSDELSAYNEGMIRIADIMDREAHLRGRSEFAIYRHGRLINTEVVEYDHTEEDVTPEENNLLEGESNQNEESTEQSSTPAEDNPEDGTEESAEAASTEDSTAPAAEEESAPVKGEQLILGVDFIDDPMASQPKKNVVKTDPIEAPCGDEVEAIAGHEIAGQLSFMDETEDCTVKLVDQKFEDDSIVVTFEAAEDATLWRKIGDSERTKKLKAGTNEVTYKIDEGEEFEFRLETEDGTVLGRGTR